MLLSLLLLAFSAITGFPTAFGNLAVAYISAFSGVPAAAGVIAFDGIFADAFSLLLIALFLLSKHMVL